MLQLIILYAWKFEMALFSYGLILLNVIIYSNEKINKLFSLLGFEDGVKFKLVKVHITC